MGPLGGDRTGAPGWLAGRTRAEQPAWLRWRLDQRGVREVDPLHRPGGDLPAAGRASRRHPRLRDRVKAERAATIRRGVRAMSAIMQTTVPWCSIILRKCFGVAGAAHRPDGRFSMRHAWPSARWGSLPLAGGLQAAYKRELEQAQDPAAKREEKARLEQLASPFRTAERFGVEEIIDPRESRRILCEFANLCAPLRGARARGSGIGHSQCRRVDTPGEAGPPTAAEFLPASPNHPRPQAASAGTDRNPADRRPFW